MYLAKKAETVDVSARLAGNLQGRSSSGAGPLLIELTALGSEGSVTCVRTCSICMHAAALSHISYRCPLSSAPQRVSRSIMFGLPGL